MQEKKRVLVYTGRVTQARVDLHTLQIVIAITQSQIYTVQTQQTNGHVMKSSQEIQFLCKNHVSRVGEKKY